MRKSLKIVIGCLGALGTIGLLHFVVFRESASRYQEQKEKYDRVRQEYAQQGQAPSPEEMNRFRYETLKHKLDYWKTTQDLGFYLPDELKTSNKDQERQELWDILRRLEELRELGEDETSGYPDLSFMANRWLIVESLPEQLLNQGIAVEDVLTEIRNENRLLNSLDPDSPAFQNHSNYYAQLLNTIGVSEETRDQLSENAGRLVATLYILNRIDQVMNNIPEEFWSPGTTDSQRLEQMYDLLRIEWPKDPKGIVNNFVYAQQGWELVDMIESAADNGIEEIPYVKLHPMRLIYWTEPPDPNAATPTPEPLNNRYAGMFGKEGGGRFGGVGGLAGGRFGGAGGLQPEPAEPEGELVGLAVPIEMLTTGENSSTMGFLYEMTHALRPVEMDRLRIRSNPDPGSPVQALGYYNFMGYVTLSENEYVSDIQKRINELELEYYSLATQIGSGELAVEDGIAERSGAQFRLTVTTPTPWVEAQ